jgi:hypothetical protein
MQEHLLLHQVLRLASTLNNPSERAAAFLKIFDYCKSTQQVTDHEL